EAVLLLGGEGRQRGGAAGEQHDEQGREPDAMHRGYRRLIGGIASDDRSGEGGGSAGSDRSMTALTGRFWSSVPVIVMRQSGMGTLAPTQLGVVDRQLSVDCRGRRNASRGPSCQFPASLPVHGPVPGW